MIVQDIGDTLPAVAPSAASTEHRSQNDSGRKDPRLRGIRKAERFIIDHLSESVSLTDVANAANMKIRTLSRAFHMIHGVSPMVYLRIRRLEATRTELLNVDPSSTTVTDIAMRYGFQHLGRFSGHYREMFYEFPSETLMR